MPTKTVADPAPGAGPVEMDGACCGCEPGGATTRWPKDFKISDNPMTRSCSDPLTCTPSEKPPRGISDAVWSPTFMPPACRAAMICFPSTAPSASREYVTTLTERPENLRHAPAISRCWAIVKRRGAIWASNLSRSIRSCSAVLLASAASFLAISAALLASAIPALACSASVLSPAIFSSDSRFACAIRSFASFSTRAMFSRESAFTSSIRAFAATWMAFCALFPDHQTRNVPNTVIASRSTYAANIQLCHVWAARIASPDEVAVDVALALLGVTVIVVGVLAIITSNKRTAAIIKEYCNTKKT